MPSQNLILHSFCLVISASLSVSCVTPPAVPALPVTPSMFSPASPEAAMLATFGVVIHIIMAIVFVGVTIAALFLARRFRSAYPAQQGRRIFGNVPLELGWTIAPAAINGLTFVVSRGVMCSVDPEVSASTAQQGPAEYVQATGRQWWWEYRLPEYGVITANELHLPLNQRAAIELRADDVMHNWWVPQLTGKRYMIPGSVNSLWFTPTEIGAFGGVCGEFCGLQHAWMRTLVIVESDDAIRQWAQRQAASAEAPQSPLAQQGESGFAQRTCWSCHAIRGRFQATANAGPDLTHMAGRSIIAAGVLENNAENMARWLRNPQDVKPGNLMPNLQLSDEEVRTLTACMLELR